MANDVIKAADIDVALDQEMAANFEQDYNKLADILGIFAPEVVAAGTALYQYKTTGALADMDDYEEGGEVPLSKYAVDRIPVGAVEALPYRKMTSAQSILKGGYENAVMRTDKKMLGDIRAIVLGDFFKGLKEGTATASAESLQMVLAKANATATVACKNNNDAAGTMVYFVNPFDVSDYLGNANVTTQTVFGMQYLNGFLGVEHMFATADVDQGKIYATPIENIHIYGVDFGALAQSGLAYTASDSSLIGVAHEGAYNHASAATNVLVGAKFLAENLGYIVKGTITAPTEKVYKVENVTNEG